MTGAEYRLLAIAGKNVRVAKSLGVYRDLEVAEQNRSSFEANGFTIEVQKKSKTHQ